MTLKKNKRLLLGLSIATIFALGLASFSSAALAETVPGGIDRDAVTDDVSVTLVPIGPVPFAQHNFGSESISLYWGVDTARPGIDYPLTSTIGGFTVDAVPTAKFTTIVADQQDIFGPDPVFFNTVNKGILTSSDGLFWDTFTADVSSDVLPGDIAATVDITTVADCLTNVGIVFEEGSGQPSGYTADGVALRGQLSGVINVAGIPAGNIPVASYLYWNYQNDGEISNQIDINGNTVTADLSGSDIGPCWPSFASPVDTFGYVAEVTPYVSGNGAYTIDNLAAAQFQQGATLVVVHHPGVITCDAGDNICKTVLISQENEDGVIEVGELVTYDVTVNANHNQAFDILNAWIKDNFGGDVEIVDPAPLSQTRGDVFETGALTPGMPGDCEVKLKGKTQKAQVRCDAGTLPAGVDAGFTATVQTDINPGQKKTHQKLEYTSCGIHDMNSGATLHGFLDDGFLTPVEFSTDSVSVEVFELADLSGDCDRDGIIDSADQCPFEPETVNGFEDLDGCPDVAP